MYLFVRLAGFVSRFLVVFPLILITDVHGLIVCPSCGPVTQRVRFLARLLPTAVSREGDKINHVSPYKTHESNPATTLFPSLKE